MPIINGINLTNILSISGVPKSSIKSISGVDITQVICNIVSLGFSDGKIVPPSFSCVAIKMTYDFDNVNLLLYKHGFCGQEFAISGYYSDEISIFFWDGSVKWYQIGNCKK